MTTIVHVRAGLIDAGPNDRGTFDAKALEELAASIAAHGLAQPPTLRPIPQKTTGDHHRGTETRFEIVAGERRTRAMRDVLGWELIPALVRELSDEQAPAWYRSTIVTWANATGRPIAQAQRMDLAG